MNNLGAAVSDEAAGSVLGSGRFARHTSHDITATANPGYHFVQWNDSVTDPTRTVLLTQDTLFTAYFLENDRHVVEAVSIDESLGTVTGGGIYREGETATLVAMPTDSSYFVMWTDGEVENPRQFVVSQDTSFTALFELKSVYRVDLSSDYPMLGTVAGDGLYYDGDTATIQAIGSTGLAFVSWTDGDTANPRQVLVTRDTAFTAHFRLWTDGIDGILPAFFTLLPNPAQDYVTLTCQSGTQRGEAVLRDALGKELRRVNVEQGTARIPLSDIPAGVYLVTLTTDQGTSTQRLVVK